MSKFKKVISSLSFNIISAIVILLLVFSLIVSSIGYVSFTDTLKREYKTTTYHMTEAAKALVDETKIDDYLNDTMRADYEYRRTNLKSYCNYMDVTLIHIFKVDQMEYLNGTNIFNVVNDKDLEINGGTYTEWDLGFKYGEKYTGNYRDYYEQIYTKEIDYAVAYRTKNLRGKEPHITVMVPILDEDGDVTAILSIQRPMSELVSGRRPYMITIAISTVITLLFVCTIAALYIKFQFVKPIGNIIDETRNFAKDNTKGELSQSKKSRILEINELSYAVDKMEDDMIKYIDSLTQATTEQKRISVELNIAKSIQEASVPNVFPAFPDRTDFNLFAYMHPAKEVGGDFYNFALIDENHLALVMADVAGKGIPAALFMMVSNILLTERLRGGDSPADALTYVNDRICARNPLNMFVTIWVGILDLETGVITASNAGHDDPVVYSNNTFEIFKDKHGLIVGAMGEAEYSNYDIKLEKGDKIFLYTDGVPEATNGNNELFKIERMVEVLNKHKNKSPNEIIKTVKKAVDEFVGDAPQFDDITMLCLEYNGKE
ncbi:MAG: PP2C family protein-serine/threonine phosphatase [Acholeplasmatales bacterium]|nr:PP2C family protein-serine/threonine phosphatase [Acholeplasmatales bacterium]